MKATEAAALITAIQDSLKSNPDQFQFTVNVSAMGYHSTASAPGAIGTIARGGAGGPGIYAVASMENTSISIAQQKAKDAVNNELQKHLTTLSEMVADLKKQTPEKSTLQKLLRSLTGTWFPGLITSLISNIITMTVL